MFLRIGKHAVGELLGFRGSKRRHIQRLQVPVNPDLWWRIGRYVEIAATHLQHLLQQIAQRNIHECWLLPSPDIPVKQNRTLIKARTARPLLLAKSNDEASAFKPCHANELLKSPSAGPRPRCGLAASSHLSSSEPSRGLLLPSW